MIVKLLTEHYLEFLSLKGGNIDSSESTHVKMPHCWKSHALAHIVITITLAQLLVTKQHSQNHQQFRTINIKCYIDI